MRSIRWKLILSSFLVVLLPVLFLNRYAVRAFDRFTSKALEESMISEAFMLGEHYRRMVLVSGNRRDAERRFAEAIVQYRERVQCRMQILSPDGLVLFDSEPGGQVGEDLSGRPEVAAAMQGIYDADWRITPGGRKVFYYVPLPIREEDRVVGIAYVSQHTGQITKAIVTMKRDQRLAMWMALAAAALVSAAISLTLTRPLRRLTRATRVYARGDAPLEIRAGGRDEIGELATAISHMADEIESRHRYNREFMSTVMHELKMPVTAIKGAAELLEQGAAEKPEARTKFLGNIRYESDRLTRMVWELGELTKLDAESLRGQKQEVDYMACLRDILDRLMTTFDPPHARFEVSFPDTAVAAAIVPGRIEQVLANLLENAFRYTPADGTVRVRVECPGDRTVVTIVEDTGSGVSETHLPRIFDRFYTTEPKGQAKDYGSGLGLAIARTIVENHGGRIDVEAGPEGGASFRFTLPLG